MTRQLLIIDDDRLFCDAVAAALKNNGIITHTAHNGEDGIARCHSDRIDVILLDQNLPDGKGIDLCAKILTARDQAKIIFITAYPSFEHAVDALRNGAYNYLSKPLDLEELTLTIEQAFRTAQLERVENIQKYREHQENKNSPLIGHQDGLRSTWQLVQLAASNNAPVLITGETGTGKSVIANNIHHLSAENSASFIGINCAALPENLIEAELFGYEKGAFTGADSAKKGIFEMADGGTLFLDEIGELPLLLQTKLLGVLDDGTLRRLGGQTIRKVAVRIIAATNRNIEEAITQRLFRQDLFYRLGVMRIHIPPLRQRTQDIETLCNHFIRIFSPDQQLAVPSPDLEMLCKYPWPGNVRELRNVIERSIILKQNSVLSPASLLYETGGDAVHQSLPIAAAATSNERIETLAEIEKQHLIHTLTRLDHNHTQTARALGISRSTLIRKLDRLGIRAGAPQ